MLTDISGSTLTSTATIDSVQLEHNGEEITCRDSSGVTTHQRHILVRLKGSYIAYTCKYTIVV